MSMNPIISVERISKAYEIYTKPSDMLREALFGGNRHDLFWALRDVSFQVVEKQRIGIIGPNGAGKSTLLQLITGNLKPSSGNIRVDGKVSALLSLVPAWNQEETGIENIRFNLLLQGCDPQRIPALTEEIVDFTELGPFIYRPVKTYSSGMGARLSFAIATSTQPDILIIDEVLATGDAYFVGKAYKRMTDFCAKGRALLFVSHAGDAIRRMCDTVVWLQNGTVRQIGPTEYVLKQYEEDYRRQEDETLREENIRRSSAQRQFVVPGDLVESGVARFRIAPESEANFADTHYVRRVCVEKVTDSPLELSLDLVDFSKEDVIAGLDILTSEWGRTFDHRGSEARVLTRFTGRSAGGHLIVKLPHGGGAEGNPIRVTFEAMSIRKIENLAIQFLNMKTARWHFLPVVSRTEVDGDWQKVVAEGLLPSVDSEDVERAREAVAIAAKPQVEIEGVWMEAAGGRSGVVREREAFSIKVSIRANRHIHMADVGIKFMRTDGVYVFWQSSGMTGGNLSDFEGQRTVVFSFDENLLGAGDYLVTAYVANGWNAESNYPYSEIFCRTVNAMKFSVRAEIEGLDMGQLNCRARVEVI